MINLLVIISSSGQERVAIIQESRSCKYCERVLEDENEHSVERDFSSSVRNYNSETTLSGGEEEENCDSYSNLCIVAVKEKLSISPPIIRNCPKCSD